MSKSKKTESKENMLIEVEKSKEINTAENQQKIKEVLKVVNLGCGEVTEKSYQKQIIYFLKELGEEPAENLKEAIKAFVMQEKASVATRKLRKNALIKYFKTVLKNPLEKAIIVEYINELPIPKKNTIAISREEILSVEQVERIRAIKLTIKQRAVFEGLVQTGLRASELTGIKLSDIKPSNHSKTVAVVTILGKGGKLREIYMHKEIIDMARQAYKGEKYLYEGENGKELTHHALYANVKSTGIKAGLTTVLHPHMLRHTFATQAVKEGRKSIKAISIYLGHSSTAITQDIYVHDGYTAEDFE